MGKKLRAWISALRPRTLFLAIATTLCGSGIAYSTGFFRFNICILTVLTATFLQLLANLANDLGDYQHGTDVTGKREGPTRAIQSGIISPREMIRAIWITILITGIVGLLLIKEAAFYIGIWYMLLFLILGTTAIIASIKYTAGKNPYGYKGLGDIFAFIFFGPVSVVGTFFLHTHHISFQAWLPSIALGLLTVAVLNINNIRDSENDNKSGKITIAVRLGSKKAKLYHAFLTVGAFICFLAYNIIYKIEWYQNWYLLLFILLFFILFRIIKIKENKLLDPYLKYTSLSVFFLSLAFIISINLHI